MTDGVTVTEVGPRDGLQSLGQQVPTSVKIAIVEELLQAGLRSIEITAFARPDVIPALSDAEEVLSAIPSRYGVDRRVLVPNLRGAERAIAAGPDTLVALVTASESYSRRNQNRGVDELVDEVGRIARLGTEAGLRVEVVLGTAFFCPYEGAIPEEHVERLVQRLLDHRVDGICLGASAGLADPAHVHRLCSRLLQRWPDVPLGLHLHDSNGMALASVVRAHDAGVRRFESAICGIGGGIAMPPGMTVGNVPTEDLVHMLCAMGLPTGLELEPIIAAAGRVAALLGIEPRSHAARGGTPGAVLARARKGEATTA
ncbi:MAG: hydroxymethylglutaryl-CoA lyase [Euzebyales bacterium]|nr:hydroxymethylglutaryl-CoA lyase [Euzebyales bacterium]